MGSLRPGTMSAKILGDGRGRLRRLCLIDSRPLCILTDHGCIGIALCAENREHDGGAFTADALEFDRPNVSTAARSAFAHCLMREIIEPQSSEGRHSAEPGDRLPAGINERAI